ncbi:3'-5' exonuclease [Crinalium epipsammum]|uniref:3'-5' exonuclease n=1 Tax=Crinalium epipsammum TaxID=241425 RepID=UPI000315E15E
MFIPGLGYLPNMSENAADEARLLYVAMTRAIEQLVITYHQQSKFTEKLQAALNKFKLNYQ